MLKKLLAALGIGIAAASPAAHAGERYSPYKKPEADFIYNLLFCDDLALFRGDKSTEAEEPWATVLAAKPRVAALRAIADDESQESRVRVLAYNRLREMKQAVPSKRLLGVIVEVPLESGLDVLAAFPDGRVRYINQSGKMSIFEASPPEIARPLKKLIAASQPVVNQIGPWDKPRLAPPEAGLVRLTFLVSDGLYFGQGPYAQLRRDAMAGPVLAAAEQLLQVVVDKSLEEPNKPLEPTR